MIIFAAIANVTPQGEDIIIVQRVHIYEPLPLGVCGSRIHYTGGSSTCYAKPDHKSLHKYRKDKKPDLQAAKKAVLAKHKGGKFIGWFNTTVTLNNSADVEIGFDHKKDMKGQ